VSGDKAFVIDRPTQGERVMSSTVGWVLACGGLGLVAAAFVISGVCDLLAIDNPISRGMARLWAAAKVPTNDPLPEPSRYTAAGAFLQK
jgi:hypothetical protein